MEQLRNKNTKKWVLYIFFVIIPNLIMLYGLIRAIDGLLEARQLYGNYISAFDQEGFSIIISLGFIFLGLVPVFKLFNSTKKLAVGCRYIAGVMAALTACDNLKEIITRFEFLKTINPSYGMQLFFLCIAVILIGLCCFLPDKLNKYKRVLSIVAVGCWLAVDFVYMYPFEEIGMQSIKNSILSLYGYGSVVFWGLNSFGLCRSSNNSCNEKALLHITSDK